MERLHGKRVLKRKGSTTSNEDASISEMMLLKIAGANAAQASEAVLKVRGKCNLIEGQIGLKLGEKSVMLQRTLGCSWKMRKRKYSERRS